MWRDMSEQRNATRWATSSGVANRPTTVSFRAALANSGGMLAIMSVSTMPGATTLTLTLNLPSSLARDLDMAISPPFDAA